MDVETAMAVAVPMASSMPTITASMPAVAMTTVPAVSTAVPAMAATMPTVPASVPAMPATMVTMASTMMTVAAVARIAADLIDRIDDGVLLRGGIGFSRAGFAGDSLQVLPLLFGEPTVLVQLLLKRFETCCIAK